MKKTSKDSPLRINTALSLLASLFIFSSCNNVDNDTKQNPFQTNFHKSCRRPPPENEPIPETIENRTAPGPQEKIWLRLESNEIERGKCSPTKLMRNDFVSSTCQDF